MPSTAMMAVHIAAFGRAIVLIRRIGGVAARTVRATVPHIHHLNLPLIVGNRLKSVCSGHIAAQNDCQNEDMEYPAHVDNLSPAVFSGNPVNFLGPIMKVYGR